MSTLTGIEVWEKIKIPSLQIKPTNNMWIFNNQAASMHAALVHCWHLHIIEDLIDDDDQDDGQQPNHQGMLNASQLKHSTIILV